MTTRKKKRQQDGGGFLKKVSSLFNLDTVTYHLILIFFLNYYFKFYPHFLLSISNTFYGQVSSAQSFTSFYLRHFITFGYFILSFP